MATAVLDHGSDAILDNQAMAPLWGALNYHSEMSWSSPAGRDWGYYIDKLLGFRSLKADWDGEGAAAVNPKTVDLALRFALSFSKQNGPLPAHLAPSSDGTIAFEWQGNAGRVTAQLEVIDGLTLEYFEMRDSEVVQHSRCTYESLK